MLGWYYLQKHPGENGNKPVRDQGMSKPISRTLGDATMILVSINLEVKAESITKAVEFLVVDRPASYNVVVGTPWLNSMPAILSTFHLCLKFLTPYRIKIVQGDRKISQVCFAAKLKRKKLDGWNFSQIKEEASLCRECPRSRFSRNILELRKADTLEEKSEPTWEPVISVFLEEVFHESCVEIGANLYEPLKTKLIACLKKNLHKFTWAAEDMPGIKINITCHELNIARLSSQSSKKTKVGTGTHHRGQWRSWETPQSRIDNGSQIPR